MLRVLSGKKGQATASEYVLMFFIGVTIAVAMTVYFKRAVQARIWDARNYMIKEVHNAALAGNATFYTNMHIEYEPYYGQSNSVVKRTVNDKQTLRPGLSSGIFTQTFNEATEINTASGTAAPKAAD